MQSWADQAREAVRRGGHNRGAARDALIALLEREQCALTAFEIEQRLSRPRPVARASVYRALELLHDLGLISRVELGDGVTRYERAGQEHHHHHIVCDRCGRLMAFDDARLEAELHRLGERLGVDLTAHEVTLRGSCPDCR